MDMPTDISISVEHGVTRVLYRGKVRIEDTTQMLRNVGQIAAGMPKPMLLFDIREADYRDYYAGTLQHAEEGPSLGIERSFRIAFLGAAESPMLRFIENATVNRGYLTKVFTDEAEALSWLHAI